MYHKKYIFSFLLLIYTLAFTAQNIDSKNYTLKWNDKTTIKLVKNQVFTLPVVENNYVNEYNVPTYSTSFNVQKNVLVQAYQIKNVKFSTVPKNISKNITTDKIPKSLISDFSIHKGRSNSLAILNLSPLIMENGQIKKVESFTLDYSLTNKISKKAPLPVYKSNSVLANGTWYKFSIDTTGIFKIDKNLLQKIGVNTNGLDPKNIRIYGNGGNLLPMLNSEFRYDDLQENTIYIKGEEDGSFDNNDYILFYGKGPHSWNLNSDRFKLTKHVNNIYSDKAYYFITIDNGTGKRINQVEEITQPADEEINTFQDFLVHEIDKINLFANGQQWLGEDFSFNDIQTFKFKFNNIDQTQEITLRIRAAAIAYTNTSMQAKINGTSMANLSFRSLATSSFALARPAESDGSALFNQDELTVEITYNNQGNPSAKAYLDYIEILGTKNLIASNQQLSFRNIHTTDENKIYTYKIQNKSNIHQLWDVSSYIDPKQIIDLSTGGNDFIFKSKGGTVKEFIIVNDNDYFLPETVQDNKIDNQNLHKLKDIDYVIITQDFLMNEAERLAAYHRDKNGLNTKVIELDQIYNEFGSGSPDLTAVRDFVRFLYLNASSENSRIKYVCLFGDSSFDFKDRITDNNNIVPAFQSFESFNLVTSYVTDDYFGFMDDNEGGLSGSDLQDVATGRFPVTTTQEAIETIDKTLNYYHSNSYGDWRNSLTFVADDPDEPSEFILQKAVDDIAEDIKANKPGFNIKKIYADAYQQETSAGGERYPTVNEAITNAVETGTLVVDYFGHGGINGWAEERILEVPQIQAWNNFNTLPLFVTVTCEFSRFDNPLRPTAGEYTFLNKNGGAVSLISTTREIFISLGQDFNRDLVRKLFSFNNENYTISEALMYSKHNFSSAQRFFIYAFGDPAMKLAQPKPNIVITKINDKDIIQSKDTLKALSHIKLEGIVTDINNQIINNYNGTIFTTIYDKALDKTTLDNNNFGRTMEFTSIESKIFRGKASVSNGLFTFDFIVPKDIRIAYGNAKISLYANDTSQDKWGYNLDVTIGGINTNAAEDSEGPIINLFMNDESFVDGGNTSGSPLLFAVLEDNSGINTSITSVDHDIIAILDDDNANPIILNDYYETELDNFKKGTVKFPLRNIKSGLHQVKFKCWDTYNNPSESTLSFVVVDDNDLVLSNVLNYPNPFVNYTEFWFNHNKPNESLEVLVQIFTVSGKLIKTLSQSVKSDGLLSREITWDGLDDFGNKIGKGVYIYKLQVKSLISNVKAEKFEKLVILQ